MVHSFIHKGMKVDETPLKAFSLTKKGDKFIVSRKHANGTQVENEEYDQVFNCWGRFSRVDNLGIHNFPAIKYSQGTSTLILGGNHGVAELTNDERVFAVGDVLRGTTRNNPAAEFGGKRAAQIIKDLIDLEKKGEEGKNTDVQKTKEMVYSKYRNYSNNFMPLTVFTSPSASMIGMTEKEAISKFGAQDVGSVTLKRYSLLDDFCNTPNSDLHLYKLVFRKSSDSILGIHYVGDQGEEVIYGLGVALRSGLTRAALQDAFFVHPSRSEVFWKASEATESGTIESC